MKIWIGILIAVMIGGIGLVLMQSKDTAATMQPDLQTSVEKTETQPQETTEVNTSSTETTENTTTTNSTTKTSARQDDEGGYTADITFTLQTNISEGRLVYIGVGGNIDGETNPTLRVAEGAFVQINITNGDGAMHDLVIDEFDVLSDRITGIDSSTTVAFMADQRGEFSYYCGVPGHRAAGMEGKLIVGDPVDEGPAVASIVRDPADLPASLGNRAPQKVRIDLEAIEMTAQLASGATYTYWTFNGLVPGPFIRVKVGDTVEVHMKNAASSAMIHSVDFHAVTGPGGGAVLTQTAPGGELVFTFEALNPGLYVYHCATPMVAHHITNGMYGMILVEPAEGLPPVDREFYVMQGEMYTVEKFGAQGELSFSVDKLLSEEPEFFVFNGAVGALTSEYPMQANVGETVRIFFGVGGPNYTSSFHLIGEIFDRVYDQASITSPPLTDVQTTLVPPGGATMVEFKLDVPGRYIMVDHALSRLELGLVGFLYAEGEDNEIFYEGSAR